MDRMLTASPGMIAVQKLAGAMATGTHGQGLRQSSLADEALRIRMVLADGSVREFTRGEPDFPPPRPPRRCLWARSVSSSPSRCAPSPSVSTPAIKMPSRRITLSRICCAGTIEFALSKAWWFVDDNLMHVWSAHEASVEESAE
ncbi:metal chaperone, involved in Zn homeostasis, GTPase of family protein|nr:metal chaperone, involved in Zn homeostasis, GTPase of family protein [Candidatus Pantoea persica]